VPDSQGWHRIGIAKSDGPVAKVPAGQPNRASQDGEGNRNAICAASTGRTTSGAPSSSTCQDTGKRPLFWLKRLNLTKPHKVSSLMLPTANRMLSRLSSSDFDDNGVPYFWIANDSTTPTATHPAGL